MQHNSLIKPGSFFNNLPRSFKQHARVAATTCAGHHNDMGGLMDRLAQVDEVKAAAGRKKGMITEVTMPFP